MEHASTLITIDPDSWEVGILALPKRFSRGAAYGFCNGHPVGRAEAARAQAYACWWPGGEPSLLEINEKTKEVATGRASHGNIIPGHQRIRDGAMTAAEWQFDGSTLSAHDLHDPTFASTWATAAGGGAVIGMGSRGRGPDVGLLWRDGADPVVIDGPGDVSLRATDGVQIAGSIRGRAMLWREVGQDPIDLAPDKSFASEIEALDGEYQIGSVFKGMCARAGLWQGSAASFRDLTPKGFQTARAYGAAQGLQVGMVRVKDVTRNGSTGCDNRAVLWEGAPDRWVDLNAMLPPDYNASVAWAITVSGNEIRICGEASRYEATHAGSANEDHCVPIAHPAVWSARLRAA